MSNSTLANLTAEIINPVILGIQESFQAMLDVSPKRTALYPKTSDISYHPISAVISLSGTASGCICLSMTHETAFNAVEILMGIRPEEIDEMVCDTVAEFANMIGGSAKNRLEHLDLDLGLPTIVRGWEHEIDFPSAATPLVATFDSSIGAFLISFGFIAND